MKKKILALILGAVLCVSAQPVTSMAFEAESADMFSAAEENSGISDEQQASDMPVTEESAAEDIAADQGEESATGWSVDIKELCVEWTDRSSATIIIKTDIPGYCYYQWYTEGEETPVVDTSCPMLSDDNGEFTINLEGLNAEKSVQLLFRIMDKNNRFSEPHGVGLGQPAEPSVTVTPEPTEMATPTPEITVTPSPTPSPKLLPTTTPGIVEPTEEPEITATPEPTEEPEITATPEPTEKLTPKPKPTVIPDSTPKVTESVVKGLESPLKFYPNKFYSFTVTGAGNQNTKPKKGNIKWVPVYWSMSSNPSESQRNTVWKIGSVKGIKTAGKYNLHVFFQRYVYNGSNWEKTDLVESVTYQFRSAPIAEEKPGTPVLDGTSNSSSGIVLKWKKVSGASGYKIYRKTGNSSKWSNIATVKGSGTLVYVDGSAKAGSTYTYTVRAYKGSGLGGYNKTGIKIVRLTAPAQYTPASKASGKLTVRWKKSASASGYQIQYSTSKNFSGAKTVSTASLTKTLSGLKKGGTYYTRVRAYKKASGKTYYSAWGTGKRAKIKK